MTGSARSKSAWALGILISTSFLVASNSPWLGVVEGHVLALAAKFVAPVTARESVAVIALEADTTADEFGGTIKQLAGAKALGLVPPFTRAMLSAEPVTASAPLLQGVAHRVSTGTHHIPAGIALLPKTQTSALRAFIPGILTGVPEPVGRIDMDLMPVFPSDAAVLDFRSGDGVVYRAPLVRQGDDVLLPGFALRLAALASGKELQSSGLHRADMPAARDLVATDWGHRAYPRPVIGTVPVVPAREVRAGRFDPKDKVVLVGLVDDSIVDPIVFAGSETLSPVMAEALLTNALLNHSLFTVPAWSLWAQLGAFATVALIIALVLPRLALGTGIVLTVLLAFIMVIGELSLLGFSAIFVPLTAAVLALAAGNAAHLLKRRLDHRWEASQVELASANRLLGQAYHAQGQLDGALERYRRCPVDADLHERLYTLGLDFERRRQFGKAASTFAFLVDHAPKFRDTAERLQRNREADGQLVFGKPGANAPTGTVILSDLALTRPVLGRYEVERELGRGAMGAVYLGRDPKIGRTVAIKTMALAQEFEGEGLEAVRERFFREAETAGRLAHPNIVTIYDVGEEQDLAYIAMDYLKGQSLAAYSQATTLLPVKEVLTIAIDVAEALDYAHGRHVVHRDIKPANIVYDRDERVVKVTDFGVACLTDASKTRTGTVLGSPSYMSPEQVAGRKVDGRADIFSLGVTLFQLLSGELPFKGDSLASLMYQIANAKPTDLRKLRSGLPACTSRIIVKALQKEPAQRYQSGSEMAAALRRCRDG